MNLPFRLIQNLRYNQVEFLSQYQDYDDEYDRNEK